jgi:hypothetical protein
MIAFAALHDRKLYARLFGSTKTDDGTNDEFAALPRIEPRKSA